MEEEEVGEEEAPAGEHAGHGIKVRLAVTKSGLRIPKFWYVASGPLKGAEGGLRTSLESLKKWIDERLAEFAPRGAELPDRVKSAVLARLPEWADGAYIERAMTAAWAAPVPEDLRRKVLRAIAEAAVEAGGGRVEVKSLRSGRAAGWRSCEEGMILPSPPPKELARPLGAFPIDGSLGLRYFRLDAESAAEPLAEKLDALAPGWRGMGLHVPVALIDNLGFVNALKRLREQLGLKGRTGAELFKEAVERLAEWEGSIAQAGKGVLVEAVPVKRSKWHEGFYFNDDWRRVRAALPLGRAAKTRAAGGGRSS